MIKLKLITMAVMGCGLLQGCTTPDASRPLAVSAVVRGDLPGNQAASWNRLARFHHERGQLALALGAYAQSLALDAHQLEARNALAVIEAQQGNLDAARRALLALVNDYPGEAQPHTNLGYVQHLMGDHAAASQTLRRAMALGAGPKAFQNLQLAEAAQRPAPLPASDTPQLAAASTVPAAAQVPALAAPIAPDTARAPSVVATPDAPPVARAEAAPSAQTAAPAPASPAVATVVPAADARTKAASVEAEPAAPRKDQQLLTVLPNTAREIGSHMELIKVAANVYELKARAAAEPPVAVAAASAPRAATGRAARVPPATQLRLARLEVSNGNGVTGMARRFRHLLGQMGIPVERLSNDKPYKQVATTIQYSPGFEQQAASLQKALQGRAQLTSKQLATSDMRLVLGKDADQSLTAATEAAGLTLVALHDDGSN